MELAERVARNASVSHAARVRALVAGLTPSEREQIEAEARDGDRLAEIVLEALRDVTGGADRWNGGDTCSQAAPAPAVTPATTGMASS